MSVDNARRSKLRDGRRYSLRGLSAFELRSYLKTLIAHIERRSDLSRLSAHTERRFDLNRLSAYTEWRSELKRLSAHTKRRSELNRLSAHTERRFELKRLSIHTERRSDLLRVSAHTERRSHLRRVSAHTERRFDLRRRLHGSSLKLKRSKYEQRWCSARLLRSRHHTILLTRGAVCKYCGAYCISEENDVAGSAGRASGASRSPDCGLSVEFVDIVGNADSSVARDTSDVGDAKRASGRGASWCDCWAAPSGTGDATHAESASWCAVPRGSWASRCVEKGRVTPWRTSTSSALWRWGERLRRWRGASTWRARRNDRLTCKVARAARRGCGVQRLETRLYRSQRGELCNWLCGGLRSQLIREAHEHLQDHSCRLGARTRTRWVGAGGRRRWAARAQGCAVGYVSGGAGLRRAQGDEWRRRLRRGGRVRRAGRGDLSRDGDEGGGIVRSFWWEEVQGVRRGVTHRCVEFRRCGAAGRAAGCCVDFSTCVAAARWRGGGRYLLRVANFAQLLEDFASLCSGCVDFASLRKFGHVRTRHQCYSRDSRGNIFNNKIYISATYRWLMMWGARQRGTVASTKRYPPQ